ncbi:MAG: hypothetical protein ACI8Y4_002170 [Candidatus Poriferisodalaceae bacterium]|jgi:hypothetical protein
MFLPSHRRFPPRSRFLTAAALAVIALLWASLPAQATSGRIEPVAGATSSGDVSNSNLASEVVGLAATPSGAGYWMASADGGVFTFGDAAFYGSMGSTTLSRPVVAIAATPSGRGYWLIASDGGIFTFGDATYHGSTGAIQLNQPIVGMAPTASGNGYWLVASDGGIFTFGDASFHGSTGAIQLNQPIVGMDATPTGNGYWLVASDGGIFTFGDAGYHGSAPGIGVTTTFVDLVAAPDGNGYSLVGSNGRVVPFGTAPLSLSARCDRDPVEAAAPSGSGLLLLRNAVPISTASPSAASSGTDSATLAGVISHAQACQPVDTSILESMISPFPNPIVTSRFGTRRHPVWGVVQLHAGADLGQATGTSGAAIRASAPGTIIAIDNLIAYGIVVTIDHGGQVSTVYGHMESTPVAIGDFVTAGETVGFAGATGFATGAHLHYEIRIRGNPIDPTPYL